MFKVKAQGHTVMYQQQKLYNMVTDKFSDVKLSTASQLKRKRTGVVSGDLKLQCICNCHIF